MNTALQTAGSAISEIFQSVNVTAHNVANFTTGDYTSLESHYKTALFGSNVDAYLSTPYISDLYEEDSLLFTMNGNYNTSGDKATQDIIFEQEQIAMGYESVEMQRAIEQMSAMHLQHASEMFAYSNLAQSFNNVSLEREFTNLILDQRALEGNAEFFHAADVMYESLLRMIPAPTQPWEREPNLSEAPDSFVAADVLHANIIEFEV